MKKKSAWWSVNYLFSLKSKMNLQKYRPLSKGLIFLNPSVRLGYTKTTCHNPIKTSGIQFVWDIFKSLQIHDLKRAT